MIRLFSDSIAEIGIVTFNNRIKAVKLKNLTLTSQPVAVTSNSNKELPPYRRGREAPPSSERRLGSMASQTFLADAVEGKDYSFPVEVNYNIFFHKNL